MLNHEQLLKLIRDKIEHPATPRELLQRLKIPREERPTLKRLLTAASSFRRGEPGSAFPIA
jgi:hypothetical protein